MSQRDTSQSTHTAALRALSEATLAFAQATTDYPHLLDVVVRRTSEAVGGFCALGLVSDDGRWLQTTTAFDPDPASLALLRRAFGRRHATHARVIDGGESFVTVDVESELVKDSVDPGDVNAVLGLDVAGLLMVPLRADGRSLGALTILRWGEGATPFDEHDLALAKMLADHAASALANARLFAAARASARAGADEDRDRLAAIVESCEEAILGKGLDGAITSWNDGATKLYGYTRQEMLGCSATVLVRADHADEEAQLMAQIARGERVVPFETVRVARDGRLIPVSLSASPIRDAAGRVVGASSIALDLTAQHQATAAKDESAQTQKLFFEASPVPIVIFDATSLAFVAVNDAAAKLYGYSREEFLTLSLLDLRLPGEGTQTETRLRVANDDGWQGCSTHRRKNGSTLEVEVLARPHRLNGRLVRMAAMQDVTERLKIEAQLRQAQKMEAIGRLAGGVAHDFNNLLSVILGYTELTLSDLPLNEPIRDDLVEVQRAAERAASLTQQLLAFSRQQVLDPRVIDLAAVVTGTEKMLRRLVGEDVELTLIADPGSGRCLVDPGQVEQVVMNLVVNARDAMPLGGKLTIETSRVELDAEYAANHLDFAPGTYALLAVTDTGCGMDQATQARIFEPFFTTKDKGKGTGLGLSTVFGIVNQSGGHVWVYSEPGVGTTFKVYFPHVTTEIGATPATLPAAAHTRGDETVLLVEDEEAVRALVRNVLGRSGYRVIDAANPDEALVRSEQFGGRIDLLVTDVIMPRMSGRQLAERLAPLRPEMRVLYMSGYTENSIVHHGVLDAGIAFLPKPVTPAALTRRVREVLDEPRADGLEKTHR